MSTDDVSSFFIGNYPNKIVVQPQAFPGSVPFTDSRSGVLLGHISPVEVNAAHAWIRKNKKSSKEKK